MTSETTTVERLAAWAAGLRASDIPRDVLELCRAQRRSVLGAVAASIDVGPAKRMLAGLETSAPDGPVPFVGRARSTSVERGVMAMAALSVALDFDDYMCFGHTGHSSVIVPLLIAGETGSSGEAQLVAQAAANEIAARLGGACIIGPLNGQMWSYIHSAGSAIATGLLLGLDSERLAHALALALHQPPRPTPPGFMNSDAKLLIAAEPAVAGIRAARLAAAGVSGPLDVLDDRHGFPRAFSYAFVSGLLGHLGDGWATRTLAVKPYPGCAYVDAAVDALLALGPPSADDITSIEVAAGLLTCGMEAMSSPYTRDSVPSPITINFSIPWTAAIVLESGRLTPAELTTEWLTTHADGLARLAGLVRVRHDVAMTRAGSTAFTSLLPPRLLAREVGYRRLARALGRMRREHPHAAVGLRDLTGLVSTAWRRSKGAGPPDRFWDPAALAGFAMTLPARVTVSLRSGRSLVAEVLVPRGAPGHPTALPGQVAAEKLRTWGPRLWGSAVTEKIEAAIAADAGDLYALLGSP